MNIKLNWKDANKYRPEEGKPLEVVKPLSDWPNVVKAEYRGGKYYSLTGNEIETVKKFRYLGFTR